jgi:hypothetical protein
MNPVSPARAVGRAMQTRLKEEGGRLIISSSQDCTPIAERAKALHNAGIHGSSEMRHVAEIPKIIFEKYCNENGVSFAEAMSDPVHIKRICNNPDNQMFRVWPGKI